MCSSPNKLTLLEIVKNYLLIERLLSYVKLNKIVFVSIEIGIDKSY